MPELIDRKAYLQRVGIHRATLSEWIQKRIITPTGGLFTEGDVLLGRQLKALTARHRGKYSLQQMVEIVQARQELAERHSPPGAPPPAE